ncbi:YadA family autotransporter adhesin [Burkholderia catarinensis]|uniref:YadA family autotransporter adhesin n=1 Tax=Burkholderia catarinensis TaxID=1108140 RepID=UPI001C59F4C1|nr:ESPR-type extended signal peptide-containing protein [Burkholderia catarinensis]KAG8150857.1 hypothetical protein BFF94_025645 [Burkholderia catarinensis]
MNKSYRNIWNAATNTWTAVAETAKSHSKGSARAARQAVVALALGGASIGGAFAADACTTADGASGSLDAAGACQAAPTAGGARSIGTMAAIDDTYIKFNGTGAAATAGLNSLAIGLNAQGTGQNATALGTNTSASAMNTTAIGSNASATGAASTAVGMSASATQSHATAFGVGAQAVGTNSLAVGVNSRAANTGSIAIGEAAASTHDGAVALGAGSATDRTNSVSVGTATQQRQITNVAAGTTNTDAVNLGQMNTALSTKVDDTYVKVRTGSYASAVAAQAGDGATAVGANANANAMSAVAIGGNTTATAQNTVAIGTLASAIAKEATAVGVGAAAEGEHSSAFGRAARSTADNAVALGYGSVADRANTVSVGTATAQRQITNMAAGTQATDAVNVAQLTPVVTALGGGAVIDATTGTVTGPTYTLTNGGTQTTVGGALGALDGALTTANGNITKNSGDITAINTKLGSVVTDDYFKVDTASGATAATAGTSALAVGANAQSTGTFATGVGNNSVASGNNSAAFGMGATASAGASSAFGSFASATGFHATAMGEGAKASGSESVALGVGSVADRNNAVSVGSSTLQRQITNMAAGTQATDAVNVAQLTPVVTALGGGAVIDLTTGAVTGPTYALANGGTQTTVGGALGALDGALTTANGNIAKNTSDITTINNQLGDLASGTIGLVQQAKAGDDLTVGANTDGAAVNFTGTAGDRKLTGVAAGTVSATSTDAVNGTQLHGLSDSVASAIGGGSTVNADGSISAPSFTVGDGNGGTTTVGSVGGAVSNLDGRVTTNEGSISKLADQIGSGTVGLVQQAGAGADLTVGASTDGTAVNFTGTAGDRKLTGVADGDIAAGSSDAVTGGQLYTTNQAVAQNTADIADNRTEITNLNSQLASGQIGLVQQDATTGVITVAANTGGTSVNFAGTAGARTLSGVANGVNDDDAVTIAQLKATGLVDYTGKEIGAVTYDDISLDSVSFGGVGGTTLRNVAPGLIAAGSMDAVNGGQLHALQQQFAQQYGQLSGQMDDLTNRVGDLETGSGNPGNGGGGGVNPGAGGPGSIVVGDGSASGDNSSAIGQGAVASGGNGTAVGQGSVASGDNSSAIGQGAVASGDNSSAIGQGSSATGSGSVAIGQGSIADRDNAVSVGSAGHERQITNVADGTAPTDAVNVRQLDSAMQSVDQRFSDTNRMINDVAKNAYAGIAAAMAMPNMTPSQPGKTVVAVGAANFKSGSAVAAGATYRSRNGKWLMNGAVSVTSVGDAGVRGQVGYEF